MADTGLPTGIAPIADGAAHGAMFSIGYSSLVVKECVGSAQTSIVFYILPKISRALALTQWLAEMIPCQGVMM